MMVFCVKQVDSDTDPREGHTVRKSFRFLAPLDQCSYLPDQLAQMEYEHAEELSAEEYAGRMLEGWRRFGHMMFRPRCPSCRACCSLRVDVERFQPSRSQRRVRKANEGQVTLTIGSPRVSLSRLDLYRRFHELRAQTRGWDERDEDPISYHSTFVRNPFPTEEWCFSVGNSLVGLGLVDSLPVGLSAIYFVYDPDHRHRALGTWNILCLIDEVRRRGLPHLYLGYWVADCLSLSYKASFRPHQILDENGEWRGA
jgi:arginine-tRNA-protein transferase